MPGKLYEGITRTKDSTSRGPKGIYAVLAVLVTLLTLALIWGSVLGGQSSRVAQAQSAGSEADAYAQAEANLEGLTEPSGEREPSYAAFGNKDNPFIPVVAQTGSDETAQDEAPGGEKSSGDGGDATAAPDGEPDSTGPSSTGSPRPRNDSAGGDGGSLDGGGDGQTVTNGSGKRANCDNLQEFDRLLCEEERGKSASNNGPSRSGSGQGAPGSGGSGSSGVGDSTQTFRNGGGGAAK